MLQTVKIRLRKPTRIFQFLVRDIPVLPGDGCVVRSDRGIEYGVCVAAPVDCPESKADEYPMTVVRLADYSDDAAYRQLFVDEQRAKALCIGKIVSRSLPMRLVDVEYTLDGQKVIFYFTADDRVDFRELVRDLAHELKTRIELRHIQVRDKAKLVGGLSACGRELCCATWLGDFLPISMRMAKRQNLSLNPTKISGQCGRLMCCLAYEDHLYGEKKRKAAVAAEPVPTEVEFEAEEDEAFVNDDLGLVAAESEAGDTASFKPGCARCAACSTSEPIEDDEEGEEEEVAAGEKTDGGEKKRRRPRRRRRRKGGPKPSESNSDSQG